MGQAEADDLGLEGGALYDPLGNYRRVSGNWNDWATDRRHVPVSTRTVGPQEMPAEPLTNPLLGPVLAEPVVTSGVTPPSQ
jgi:outer membrane protein